MKDIKNVDYGLKKIFEGAKDFLPLLGTDYIEFYVIQDNSDGGGGSRTLSDSNYKPYLTGFKLNGVS